MRFRQLAHGRLPGHFWGQQGIPSASVAASEKKQLPPQSQPLEPLILIGSLKFRPGLSRYTSRCLGGWLSVTFKGCSVPSTEPSYGNLECPAILSFW